MENTLFATAFALVLHTVIALLAGMDQYPGSSLALIICVNGFFFTLFAISSILFKYVAQKELITRSESE